MIGMTNLNDSDPFNRPLTAGELAAYIRERNAATGADDADQRHRVDELRRRQHDLQHLGRAEPAVGAGLHRVAAAQQLPLEVAEGRPRVAGQHHDDLANAACYLCSDEASFVNGTHLFVDNGFTAA